MKMAKMFNGFHAPVSNEEVSLMEKFESTFDNTVYDDELTERESQLASNLASRGFLDKGVKGKQKQRIFYKRY